MDIDEAQEAGGDEGAPAWMATFSDLATLLLTFFVLMLSFANMDIQNFKTAMGSVKEAMGVQFKISGEFESLATDILELSPVQSGPHIAIEEFAELAAARVKRYVEEEGLQDQVDVRATPRGVVIHANDNVFFGVGSADMRDHDSPVMALVANVFGKFDGDLSVQGHTDSVPIKSGRYPSNWELSTSRAISVMRHLTERRGIPRERIHVAGYADTRPVLEGDSLEARTKNRRGEFRFMFPVVKGNVIAEGAFADLSDLESKEAASNKAESTSARPEGADDTKPDDVDDADASTDDPPKARR